MKVNFAARAIKMSAKEMRRASVPHSREYTELVRVWRDLPDFTIEIDNRQIPTNNPNRGLTYEFMEQHIAQNAPELSDEFYDVRKIFGYPRAAQWFRSKFPEACERVHFRTKYDPVA